ncbi:hypothetical protein [Glutamicibacter protophormiae]|uniref:DUF3558 domain-containing protein n=1 Tax=Glutamicibacter protophormiae TaxID=37930 RepID=A0ABS4XUG5_GLUPR|nr:hypothetical protein [Glutamicibacter protophormiae]MBP2400143.1 hypothetical protein [Glutamicibacter protophormiae]GGL74922.1 hypothetical protein GCM10010038_01190 [Glutamicibacter protophormiae]
MRARKLLSVWAALLLGVSLSACSNADPAPPPAEAAAGTETTPSAGPPADAAGGDVSFPSCAEVAELSGDLFKGLVFADEAMTTDMGSLGEADVSCIWVTEAAAKQSPDLTKHATVGLTFQWEEEALEYESFASMGMAFSTPQTEEVGAFLLNKKESLDLGGPPSLSGPLLVKGKLSIGASGMGAMAGDAVVLDFTNQDLLDVQVEILKYMESRQA